MRILGLTPIKNGEFFLENVFKNNLELVDNFIILDDNSTDNTVNILSNYDKILKIIPSKSPDIYFNDAYNRNKLLMEAEKYNPDYIFWIDVDEKWVDFHSIRDYLIKNIPTQLFLPKIHLYDTPNQYIKSYPNSHYGIQWKCRIVKFSQYKEYIFNESIRLHFTLNPNKSDIKFYPLLIQHYGLFNETIRNEKYEFYKINDIDKIQNYFHLIDETHKIGNTSDVYEFIKSTNFI